MNIQKCSTLPQTEPGLGAATGAAAARGATVTALSPLPRDPLCSCDTVQGTACPSPGNVGTPGDTQGHPGTPRHTQGLWLLLGERG